MPETYQPEENAKMKHLASLATKTNKALNELDKKNLDKIPNAVKGNFAIFGTSGTLVDGGLSFADLVGDDISEKMNTVKTARNKNLAVFDSVGAVVDGGFSIADLQYELPMASTSALGGVKIGDGLSISSDGFLSVTALSGVSCADIADSIDAKIDKVTTALEDNFAIWSDSGVLKDSGLSAADFVSVDDFVTFSGATSEINGLSGLVPAPKTGDENKFLRGDGTWATVSSGGSSSGGGSGLDTVPSNVYGACWFSTDNDLPLLNVRGNKRTWIFKPAEASYDRPNKPNLVSFLPLEYGIADACGNTWKANSYATGASATIPPFFDLDVKHFGRIGSWREKHPQDNLHFSLQAENIIDINADKWTFDCWFYRRDNSSYFQVGFENSHSYNGSGIACLYDGIYIPDSLSGTTLNSINNSIPVGEWTHVAFVKNESDFLAFVNGALVRTAQLRETLRTGGGFEIGRVGSYYYDGNYSDVRFYEGVARWTSDFTPPTADDYI